MSPHFSAAPASPYPDIALAGVLRSEATGQSTLHWLRVLFVNLFAFLDSLDPLALMTPPPPFSFDPQAFLSQPGLFILHLLFHGLPGQCLRIFCPYAHTSAPFTFCLLQPCSLLGLRASGWPQSIGSTEPSSVCPDLTLTGESSSESKPRDPVFFHPHPVPSHPLLWPLIGPWLCPV